MTQTPNGENNMVSEEYPLNKTLWSIFVLLVFGVIFSACKKEVIEENKVGIRKDIKEREIALYRQYRKNFEENPNINQENMKMRSMIKKIDRKIGERLSNMSLR